MRVDKIEAKGDLITIKGRRTDAGDERQAFTTSSRIEINVTGPFSGDNATAAKTIEDGVFILRPPELRQVLPGPWMALFGGMLKPNPAKNGELEYRPDVEGDVGRSDPAVVAKTARGEDVFAVKKATKDEVRPPKPIYSPDPEYTDAARKAHAEGRLILAVIIGKSGMPEEIYFVKPLGYGFDKSAFDAVRTWKFEPATKNGTPVASVVNVEVTFGFR